MNGAQVLLEALKSQGVDTIFGIPGIHNLAIYDAAFEDPSIRLVTSRDERGAAHMADGYARATGRPGVCLTVPGPGVTNALTGIGEAYADSSPVLLLASQLATGTIVVDKEDFHQLRDTEAVLRSVTQWGARPLNPDDIRPAVKEAFERFAHGRPRPCYLDLPMDVLAASARDSRPAERSLEPTNADVGSEIENAAAMLLHSERPLMLLGGGAWDAAHTLRELAERVQVPVIMSSSGKGILPEDHPLSLGDGWMVHQLGREALERADCVLAVGCRFGPLTTSWWSRRISGQIIQVDIDAAEIGKHQPATIGIAGDASLVIQSLHSEIEPHEIGTRTPWLDVSDLRERRREAIRERAPDAVKTLESLRRVLPDHAQLFNDINGIACWGAGAFVCRLPRTFHYPIGFGCLGFALPAAIGAKIARPETPIVALSGDGGFLFSGHELATAVAERAAIVAVVFNDNAYGTIKTDQAYRFPERSIGSDLRSPDFVKLAEAYGARGLRVDRLEDVADAVASALAADEPTLIEAPCPQALPPWIELPEE
ncbi:MAG TPA: thiamine pyrophosphate-binding protein [Chloroflexota bacterium]|nr:thiamine pyrophosphate-binding protein [Chloroflexota bacterium]